MLAADTEIVVDLPEGTVTFLFTDIEGSTRLLIEDPQLYADAIPRDASPQGPARAGTRLRGTPQRRSAWDHATALTGAASHQPAPRDDIVRRTRARDRGSARAPRAHPPSHIDRRRR